MKFTISNQLILNYFKPVLSYMLVALYNYVLSRNGLKIKIYVYMSRKQILDVSLYMNDFTIHWVNFDEDFLIPFESGFLIGHSVIHIQIGND